MAQLSQDKQNAINRVCTKCTASFRLFGGTQGFSELEYQKVQTLHQELFSEKVPLLPLSENLYISVLEKKGDVIGYCVLQWLYPDIMEILHMGIPLNMQNAGWGRMLLAKTITVLTELGMAKIQLEVAQTNFSAKKLYISAGFLSVGRRKAYYSDGTDAILLERKL